MSVVTAESHVRFHRLLIRPHDDDPVITVVGRPEIGEFVELPAAYGEAISLMADGMSVGATRRRIADVHDAEVDLAELVEALSELGFVASIDGTPLPDAAASTPRGHFRRLSEHHVAWLFSMPMKALWLVVVAAALLTLTVRNDLIPTYSDFFWSDYVGLTVLVNTAMMSASISVHELMHLTAARSLGAPGRIGFGTRLHNLVVQTDVTGVWGLPRRSRYRVYLAGLAWDIMVMASLILVIAHVPLADRAQAILQALVLSVLMAIPFQFQVYMRTDLYYVLREVLRARNLFEDGIAYAKYLRTRGLDALLRRPSAITDPTAGLAPHARRATRIYSVFLVIGASITLAAFALFTAPIVIGALVRAVQGIGGGSALMALDSGLFILVEGGIQVLFIVTFVRTHPHWFRRRSRATTGRRREKPLPPAERR
ncbi:hypothetical protein [Nonomuraea sp. B5E05]|uniref:hypothetical protein n=1 Tax=Nonomuraea sp. B5E05 TaxID=3153569 RepID=UPI003260BB66